MATFPIYSADDGHTCFGTFDNAADAAALVAKVREHTGNRLVHVHISERTASATEERLLAENAELLAELEAARELLRLHEVRWRPIVDAAAKWDEAWAVGNANPYVHADLHTAIFKAVTS